MPHDSLYREGWHQTNVRLKTEHKEALQKLAREKGVSEVSIIRAAVVQYLNDHPTKDK